MASKTEEMVEWLKAKNVPTTEDMKKHELMELVIFSTPDFPVNIVVCLAKSYSH